MSPISISEAQSRLTELLAQLAPGEELPLTDGVRIVARIIGERRNGARRPGPGLAKGMLTIVADDDEHLRDFAEYMP
jgi:antitoxin (DNA-binding transcriptional repressor) of toxin-antitoxin stability system